jgi:predicted anti-sigma-YlaC factor YlaD
MGPTRGHSWACDRARQAVSLRLDGELSQLERAVLDRHLKRCPECAAFASDAEELTLQLRGAELVPFELPLRERVAFRRRSAGAWVGVASVAATALLAVFTLPAQRVESPVPAVGNSTFANQDLRELREVRFQQLRQYGFLSRASSGGPQLDT